MEYSSFEYEIETLEKPDFQNIEMYRSLVQIKPMTEQVQIRVALELKARDLKCVGVFKDLLKAVIQENKGSGILLDFSQSKIGDELLQHNIIKRFEDNQLYIYNEDDFYYEPLTINNSRTFDKLVREQYIDITKQQKSEVLDYLKDKADFISFKEQNKTPYYIAVGNGLLNLKTGELETPTPEVYCTNKIHTDFIQGSQNDLLDETLDAIFSGNEKQKQFFYEFIGYCLYSGCDLNKMLIITGNGSNGKSLLLKLIKDVLDDEKNCAYETLQDMTETKYSTHKLYNKLVNIDDDSSKNFINDSSLLKKITYGDKIGAEEKYKDRFYFNVKSTIIVASNETAKINDKSYGIERRLILLPLKNKFIEGKNLDTTLPHKLDTDEVRQAILFNAVNYFVGTLALKKFTIDTEMEKAKSDFLKENNKILLFVDLLKEIKENPDTEAISGVLYMRDKNNAYIKENVLDFYRDWAKDIEGLDNKHIMTKTTFFKTLETLGFYSKKATKNIQYTNSKGQSPDRDKGQLTSRPYLLFENEDDEKSFYS